MLTNKQRQEPSPLASSIPGPLHPSSPSLSAVAAALVTRLQPPRAPVPARCSARLLPPHAAVLLAPPTPGLTRSFRRGIHSGPQTTLAAHPSPSPALPSAVEPGHVPQARHPQPPGQDEEVRGPDGGGRCGCGGRRAGAAASPPPAPPPSSADAPAPAAEPAPWRAAAGRPQPRSGPPRVPRAARGEPGTAGRRKGRAEVSRPSGGGRHSLLPSGPRDGGGGSKQNKCSPSSGAQGLSGPGSEVKGSVGAEGKTVPGAGIVRGRLVTTSNKNPVEQRMTFLDQSLKPAISLI